MKQARSIVARLRGRYVEESCRFLKVGSQFHVVQKATDLSEVDID